MNSTLSEISRELLPEVYAKINWGDLWARPLSNGAGFQWTILFSVVSAFIQDGWVCDTPLFRLPNGSDLMLLRNEIPQQFGSQAGHSATQWADIPLKDVFIQALIPKFVLSKAGIDVSIFYEGCPYHRIMKGVEYAIRPDILLFPGNIACIPALNSDSSEITYQYNYKNDLALEGTLRVGNFRILPITQKTPTENIELPIYGIVECTVNKSEAVALAQLDAYRNIFTSANTDVAILASGNQTSITPSVIVDLKKSKTQTADDIKAAGQLIYKKFIS